MVAWGDSEIAGAADPAELASVYPGYPSPVGLSMFRGDRQWRPLAEPCADGVWPPVGVGPAGMFCHLRRASTGLDHCVVNGGVGGTTSEQWLPGQPLFEALARRAKAAVTREGSTLAYYLLYSGANDAAAGSSAWAANSLATLAALYARVGVAPVVYAILPPTVPQDVPYATWPVIRTQQQSWASGSRVGCDVPEGHWREWYQLHLDCEGDYLLAQAMAAAAAAL